MVKPPIQVDVPTLVIDEQKTRRNIRSMVRKAKAGGIRFRPHFKTHQSIEIGRWFREEGVQHITCSSLSMAEYFATDGWTDITVAFPVNLLEIDRINRLAGQIQLNLLVESTESISFLVKNLQHSVNAYFKIDVGTHRTGIHWENTALLDQLLSYLSSASHLQFKGFLAHSGHSYGSRALEEAMSIHQTTIERLLPLHQRYQSDYPGLELSLGDTPCFAQLEAIDAIDEMRPGNFVFFDLMQQQIGSCKPEEIAVAMACPVVAKHESRLEIVLYGGAIHFSKDRIQRADGEASYGRLASWTADGWEMQADDQYLCRLSQEHGILKVTPEVFQRIRIGDLLPIIPIHSCLTADLANHYITLDGQQLNNINRYLATRPRA